MLYNNWCAVELGKERERELEELKECTIYAIIRRDCTIQAFFRIAEEKVHLHLGIESRRSIIVGNHPCDTGLIYSVDDFKTKIVWMLENDKITDVICRAENYGDLLVVCASHDDSLACNRIEEFFGKHATDVTGEYYAFDQETAQLTSYYFALNYRAEPASDTYSVYIDGTKPIERSSD